MKRHLNGRIVGLLGAVFLFHLLWFAASGWLNKPLLPSPILVYQNAPRLIEKGIVGHLGASLGRIFLGMGIALLFGAGLGLVMGRSKRWNKLLDPLVYLTYPVPKLALLPMLMLLFGLGEVSKIMLIILIVFPQVVLSVRDAVLTIPAHYYDIYSGLRASRWQQFRSITLPASWGAVLSTSRVSVGTAISILLFIENYGTKFGMGYFIMDSWMRMDYLTMYGGILVLSLVGFLIFSLIDLFATYSLPWQTH